MRGLSLGLSLGVGVTCGLIACSGDKTPPGAGVDIRPPGNTAGVTSVLVGGAGGSVIISNGGAPTGIIPEEIKDAGPDVMVDAGECATLSVATVELVPTVNLLVDTSGSMFKQPAPFWDPLYKALMTPSTSIVKQLEGSTRFGFTSYTGVGTGAMCPILQKVPYALNNYAAIDTMYSAIGKTYTSQAWETPTHAAIDATAADLVAFKAVPDGPKFILLVTDGSPDTCWANNPQCGQDAAIASIQAAYAKGIITYVLGIGNVLNPDPKVDGCQVGRCGNDYLQDIANAGVGLPVEPYADTDMQYQYSGCIANSPTKALAATYAATGGGGKAPFYTVNGSGTAADVAPLVGAIKEALTQTRSCSFAMTATLPGGTTTGVKITTNAAKGKFSYNGNPLTYSDPNGWTLNADQTGITLAGTACDSWKSAGGTVTGSFPCEVTFDEVPPPVVPK